MTFFWHEALKAVIPEVPDLFSDPIANTKRTIETMENTGWFQSVWMAVNPYARERHEYAMAARQVDLIDLTEQLSPMVKHYINKFFKILVPSVAGAVVGGENLMQIMYALYQMSSLTKALQFGALTAAANTATAALGGMPASALMASASSAMPALMGVTATTAAAALAPVATAVSRRLRGKQTPPARPLALTEQAQTDAVVQQEGKPDPRPVSVAAAATPSVAAKTTSPKTQGLALEGAILRLLWAKVVWKPPKACTCSQRQKRKQEHKQKGEADQEPRKYN
jgi:hypothetical protein